MKKITLNILTSITLCFLIFSNFINAQCTSSSNFNGRIAWTADGNDDDRDEYTALPFMAAILQAANQELVHLAYNDNLSGNRAGRIPGEEPRERPQIMRETVARANRVYNSLGNNIFDCDGDPASNGTRDGLRHLSGLIKNASSGSRLYICIAGQAQYAGLALEMATRGNNRATRADFRNVTVVSHSAYNNRNGRGEGTYNPEWNIDNITNEANGGIFDGLQVANYATSGSVHNDNLLVNLNRYDFINNNRNERFVRPIITGFEDTRKTPRLDPSDAGMAYMVLYNTNAITLGNARGITPADFDHEIENLVNGNCGNSGGGNSGGGNSGGSNDYFFIQTRGRNPRRLASRNNNSGSTLRHVSRTATGNNAQWEMIPSNNGFFFLQNRASGMFFRPQNNNVGANLTQVASTARGNRTQWQQINTSGNFFRLESRSAGRHFSTGSNGSVTLSNATGNNSQWQFVPVSASKNLELGNEESDNIIVFPNPATNNINVSSNSEAATITIMDLTGAIIIEDKFNQNFQANISHLNSGLYIVQISTANTTNITKFIKQ